MLPIRLGLCIPKGKKTRMNLPARIIGVCKEANIEIIEIDIEKNIEEQGPFDFILHKVLDYYNELDQPIEVGKSKIDKILRYTELHPRTVVIDNLEWCWRLTNRKLMMELIKQCTFTLDRTTVFLPRTLDVSEKSTFTYIKQEMNERHFKFPVLVKAHSAYFDDGAHHMGLVFNVDGLRKIRKPCLIQEFCNHSGVCYKVFVVGDRFHICERPSIKNFNHENNTNMMAEIRNSSTANIYFDSFRVSKTGQAFCEDLHESDPNARVWLSSDQKLNLLDYDVVRKIIARIRQFSGLYLYGFDILVEEGTQKYALIDINQFPSYKGIDDNHFQNDLVHLLKTLKRY